MKVLPWIITVFAVTAAILVTTVHYVYPRTDHDGLVRVPAADYLSDYSAEYGIWIDCLAWSNQPDRDFAEPPGRDWVGVRYVRDCVVVEAP